MIVNYYGENRTRETSFVNHTHQHQQVNRVGNDKDLSREGVGLSSDTLRGKCRM